MEHTEDEKAPSTLLATLQSRLRLDTPLSEETLPFSTLQAAFEEGDWQKRVEVVLAVANYAEHLSMELLVEALHDEDVSVRVAAVHVWEKRKEGIPLVRLVEALGDREWLVREAAVLAIGGLDEGATAREQFLVAALDDESMFVREAAQNVLASLAPETVTESARPLFIGFITKMFVHVGRGFMFAIHGGSNEMSQDISDFEVQERAVNVSELEPGEIAAPVRPTQARRARRLTRLAMGGLAVLVVLGIIVSWFILLPGLYSSRLAYTAPPVGTVLFKMPGQASSNEYYIPAWTDDSRYLSFVDGHGNAYVWDSITGHVKKTISIHYAATDYISWFRVPGGTYIISGEGTHLLSDTTFPEHIWNVLTGQELTFLPAKAGYYGQYNGWSNSGQLITFIDSRNDLEIWNVDTQTRLLKVSSAHFGSVFDTTWSSDDRRLAISSSDGFIEVLDTKTGDVVHSFTLPLQKQQLLSSSPYGVFWSNDLSHAIILLNLKRVGGNIPAQVWDASVGKELFSYSADPRTGPALWWLNNGTRILSEETNEVRVWNASTGQTLSSFHYPATQAYLPTIYLSPDNSLLAYYNNYGIHIWNPSSGRELLAYSEHRTYTASESISWSPDNTYVSDTDIDGIMFVWNARTGDLLLKYPFPYIHGSLIAGTLDVSPDALNVATAWSPNGKMLALVDDQNLVRVFSMP